MKSNERRSDLFSDSSCIDYFISSEQLYRDSIRKLCVIHDVGYTSDHDHLCLHLALDVNHVEMGHRVPCCRPSWAKATQLHIEKYKL